MKRLYWHLLIGAIASFGGIAVLLLVARYGFTDVVSLIFLAGSMGAVVNNYYRLSKMAESGAAPKGDAEQRLAIIQMYVSMLIASILAFVAYGLFLSGLVQGSLFPEFHRGDETYLGIGPLLDQFGPKQNVDAAKCLLWAFVAGFSERFVPNLLDTIVATTRDEARSTPGTGATNVETGDNPAGKRSGVVSLVGEPAPLSRAGESASTSS